MEERNEQEYTGREKPVLKANELRLGNWVNSKIKGCTRIKEGYVQLLEEQLYYLFDVDDDWERIDPIPLTEEWLVKFGFDKDEEYDEGGLVDYRFILMNGSLEFVSFWNSEDLMVINQPQTGVDIEHVHQLQNLYFALTSQELTIK